MNRKILLYAAVALQIIAVASIALSKEWLLATGYPVVLQTAPVDPRDLFKGDYVALDYAFSQLPVPLLSEDIIQHGLRKGQKVYLQLGETRQGVTQTGKAFSAPPETGRYLKGYVQAHWPYKNFNNADSSKITDQRSVSHPLMVHYGIEQYYVEQGQGLEMEKTRGNRNSFQVPMLIQVALSDAGDAIIRSFSWANLAFKTEILKSPERNAPDDQASAVMRFTLMNRSDDSMILPLKSGNCSFTLTPISSAPPEAGNFIAPRNECATAEISPVVLAASETVSFDFDLNTPHWQVLVNGQPTAPGKLPWDYRYRIIYQGEETDGINASIISSSFHGSGNID